MVIGIGSENKAKIGACKNAVNAVLRYFGNKVYGELLFLPLQTKTSVAEMPLTQEEMMRGALERALFVYNTISGRTDKIDFAIGLEGGVYRSIMNQEAYLQNWVYVYNGRQGHFGSSVSLPLPQKIVQALYNDKKELAEIIDQLSGLADVRSQNGAFGVLTRNIITRSASFEQALISALTPFFNKEYYCV